MKETLTLLERCQREAKELFEVNGLLEDKEWLGKGMAEQEIESLLSLAIARTLKEAASALEGMKVDLSSIPKRDSYGKDIAEIENAVLTDAQRLLLEKLDI